MDKLARAIAKELETAHHCAIYNRDLARVWPHDAIRRQKQIEKFAKKNGWGVRHYKEGVVAIFVKEPPSKTLFRVARSRRQSRGNTPRKPQ
jgi:hypothetical protein